jgi:hypothetical protein
VTKVGPEVKHGRRRAGGCVDQSGLFSSARREISSKRRQRRRKTKQFRGAQNLYSLNRCNANRSRLGPRTRSGPLRSNSTDIVQLPRSAGGRSPYSHATRRCLNRRFPTVVKALASLEGDFVLDGELVALDSEGKPSFQLLQDSLSEELPIYCYAFDFLNQDGELLLIVANCWKACLPRLTIPANLTAVAGAIGGSP